MPARLESRSVFSVSVFSPANVKWPAQPARRGGRMLPLAKTFGVRSLGRGDALRPLDATPSRSSRFQTLLADLSQTSQGLHHAPPSQKSFSYSPLVLRKDAA